MHLVWPVPKLATVCEERCGRIVGNHGYGKELLRFHNPFAHIQVDVDLEHPYPVLAEDLHKGFLYLVTVGLFEIILLCKLPFGEFQAVKIRQVLEIIQDVHIVIADHNILFLQALNGKTYQFYNTLDLCPVGGNA